MRATRLLGSVLGVMAAAAIIVSCGGTGGGSGSKGNPSQQFVLNSNNSGRLTLTVNPGEVDANKSDRIGLVAQLTDSTGRGIAGVEIVFSSDIDDITFIPNQVDENGNNFGVAVTDANGKADIIAVAGSSPTGTGEIIGTGAIFAEPPPPFGLRAQIPITLYDVGFVDTVDGALNVIPTGLELVEPAPGQVFLFSIVGGVPPYQLGNEISGIGVATLSQHCLPGCTENSLCIGSPCQSDGDCNANGSSTPANVCLGPIKRCLASCQGTNCAGSFCDSDADCNDGSSSPADVCKDSGQSIAYIISSNPPSGTHGFLVQDSTGASILVEVTVSFVCGNGTARGEEQCDLGDLRGETCESLGRPAGSLICSPECTFDFANCTGVGGSPGAPTATPDDGATPTSVTPTPTPASTPGNVSSLEVAVGDPNSNVGADNGNNTATAVLAAVASDSGGNPVQDGTPVLFSLTGPAFGAVITAQSATGNLPPQCDIANFEQRTGVQVLEQPGVAHACVTYPINSVGQSVTVQATSGSASDSDSFELPVALINPNPEPTATP